MPHDEEASTVLDDAQTYAIIGAAMEVHGELGPGYLEQVYQEALSLELEWRDIPAAPQTRLRIEYKGKLLQHHYIPDFICFETIVVEIKAHSTPLTRAGGKQILNAMKCAGMTTGLLINFGRDDLDYKRFLR